MNTSCDFIDRSYEIHHAHFDRAVGHAIVECRRGGLRHGEPAGGADFAQTERTVASRPGENHTDRAVLESAGKRTHEVIDDKALATLFRLRFGEESLVYDRQVAVRLKNVDVVRFQKQAVAGILHGNARNPRQNLRHLAFMIRGQVLQHDICRAAVRGQIADKLLQRLDPTGGRPDRDDRKAPLRYFRVCPLQR